MSRDHRRELPPADLRTAGRSDWQTLRSLFPYLWAWKGRVAIALGCLVAAKMANVGVPIVLKSIIDWLAPMASGTPTALRMPMGPLIQPGPLSDHPVALAVAVPAALLVSYGLLRLATSLFTELREFVFAKVTQRAVRTVSLQVFGHLHALSLRFHLDRQTGGLTRDVERGSRGISTLVSYTLYSILPTLVEVLLVLGWLATHYEAWFAGITVVALTTYIVWTVTVTNWRTHFRREMNDLDSKANTRAIDSLLNYETVKYFGNEAFEANRYDESLQRWERAAVRSQTSLSLLNTGQSAIIATAVTMMVWRATVGVVEGRMSLGDLVLVNAFMIQLYIPLNFLGVLYREIKQSLTDIEKMFGMLDANREVDDVADAPALRLAKSVAAVGPEVRFEKVSFSYQPDRQILRAISFVIAPARRWLWWVAQGPANPPWPDFSIGFTTSMRGASRSMGRTCARSLRRAFEPPLASCRKTPSSLMILLPTTLPMAGLERPRTRSRPRLVRRSCTTSSPVYRRDMTRPWASEGSSFRVVKNSGSPLRGCC